MLGLRLALFSAHKDIQTLAISSCLHSPHFSGCLCFPEQGNQRLSFKAINMERESFLRHSRANSLPLSLSPTTSTVGERKKENKTPTYIV